MNEVVTTFTQKISKILDIMAPVKVFQTRKKYVPWLSPETKSLMNERDRLLNEAKSTGDVETME